MFLEATVQRNPGLIEAALHLHRQGRITPNTYVIDVDAVEANAAALPDGPGRSVHDDQTVWPQPLLTR